MSKSSWSLIGVLGLALTQMQARGGDAYPSLRNCIPDSLSKVRMAMPLSEFNTVIKGERILPRAKFPFREEFAIQFSSQDYSKVHFYFGIKGDRPLYELIFEYPRDYPLENYALDRFGTRNYGSNWVFKNPEGLVCIAWVFDSKLVIVGTVPDTEMAIRDGKLPVRKDRSKKLIETLDKEIETLRKAMEAIKR